MVDEGAGFLLHLGDGFGWDFGGEVGYALGGWDKTNGIGSGFVEFHLAIEGVKFVGVDGEGAHEGTVGKLV